MSKVLMHGDDTGIPSDRTLEAIKEAKRVIGALVKPGRRFPTCEELKRAWAALERLDG